MLTIVACLAIAQAGLQTQPGQWNLSGKGPHLIFHYMPWFADGVSLDKTKPWEHWSWGGPGPLHDPSKRLPNGDRDIASVFYPVIGPYSTADNSVLRYQMETIRAAGGEAVVVDWYGPDFPYETRTRTILDEARRAGLHATLCYEEKINFAWPDFRNPATRQAAVDQAVSDLSYLLSHYASLPVFLRRNGKPFFFQFNGWGQGKLGPQYFTGPEDEEIFRRLKTPVEYARQGLEDDYDSTAQGRFLWWSADAKAIRQFAADSRKRIALGKQQFFMSFVSPGFNDSGVSGWGGKARVVDRDGLSFLFGTMTNAFAGDPELVQVVTWNDFNEGTVVEPTRQNGFLYLDAIATWWAEHTGRRVSLDALRAPIRRYVADANADERSELPKGSIDPYLARRPLTVANKRLLEDRKTPVGF